MTELRVVQRAYGGPQILELLPFTPRSPAAGEVVVRIVATSVNPIDVKTREGLGAAPVLGDLPISVGWDVAGVVERTGDGVVHLAAGDRVFGLACFPHEAGAYATHAVVPADHLARVPAGMDDQTAGALPLAGLTALSAVRDLAGCGAGDRLLVRGAGGGVGHLAVQIAKALGANVVAVVGPRQVDLVRRLGADELVDRAADLVLAEPVDAVIDLVGGPHLASSVGATRPGGVVVCVPGGTDTGLDDLAAAQGVRAERASVRPDREGLQTLAGLFVEGRLSVHVAEVFALHDVVAAHQRWARGGVLGKIGIRVAERDAR